MRPLRLLLSLASSVIAITILLYISFGAQSADQSPNVQPTVKKSKLRALFSFTSPSSLFPPSAIISLTDDNSTFFLARPAAFGPLLPSKGLSGQLWIGSGFGDDTMGRGGMAAGAEGELGCSDVPGWSDGDQNSASSDSRLDPKRKSLGTAIANDSPSSSKADQLKRDKELEVPDEGKSDDNDGTDDHLHHPLPNSEMPKEHGSVENVKASEHADIQSLQEGAEITGKIVLLSRGGCGFLEKVKWAQRRGGVALIVGDDVRGGALIRMYAHGDTSNITIPALFTSHTTAHLLSSLIPSGGLMEDLSPEDAAKLGITGTTKAPKKNDGSPGKKGKGDRPTFTRIAENAVHTSKAKKQSKDSHATPLSKDVEEMEEQVGWFRSLLAALGLGSGGRESSSGDSRRPPTSGSLNWVQVEDWTDDVPTKKATKPSRVAKPLLQKPTVTKAADDFVIGVQDWRDPDLLPQTTAVNHRPDAKKPKQESEPLAGGNVMPGSGEYEKESKSHPDDSNRDEDDPGWLSSFLGDGGDDDSSRPVPSKRTNEYHLPLHTKAAESNARAKDENDNTDDSEPHEGLWVTLTPTNMSSSPFFDTLLVLVVSPLVTLTVVYALLLLRSRIRRRRWRAPKSVVERLPVRTYHTISSDANSGSSPTTTPASSSPTTPLLQHSHSRTTTSRPRPRSRTTSEVPAGSSSFHQPNLRPTSPEEEKREAGLAEWRRRYGGRQKECVVCLEEYVDGVSRVMSLPCGHEFHAECITPWLVTRRRTCPICKGDVVRSLSASHHARHASPSPSPSLSRSPSHLSLFRDDASETDIQAQAAHTRNESPSASLPVPVPGTEFHSRAAYEDFPESDVEAAGWAEDDDDQDRGHVSEGADSGGSSIRTTIWRGFEALRGAGVGLTRRAGRGGVDRDR
ncbi:hypothetical protein BU16DRAFT_586789 [Lophium mytilinum]|uniref:RING-type E3 ubiquitin transferase n=1 Tax=Lophium mytilinum TaxID=390894 RepID=A0A6A6QAM7_9PEZI|nr:hypothetical protein BU16DRAFT_586789 [Lophium mytilinum]